MASITVSECNGLKMRKANIDEILEELKWKAIEHYGDRLFSLVVFGSVAKGVNTPESDIDLLVVLKEVPRNNYERYKEFLIIEDSLKTLRKLKNKGLFILISPMIKSVESMKPYLPWLWDTEFSILYDKDKFFNQFIIEINEFKKIHLNYKEKPLPHYVVIKEW